MQIAEPCAFQLKIIRQSKYPYKREHYPVKPEKIWYAFGRHAFCVTKTVPGN